ncbi:serine hydrolase [Paludisphaera borealis]|uniref:Penicillin-binding protein 4 n=1 Tax=Paludisphaera borealis TaxID=1387353 RepID=A0A1U7CS69_9BACT|nr:serine hydrolase [Paludisphaera borealis]APW61785.1 Penicillin-binding protein 4* [Paludisphaera borealis]
MKANRTSSTIRWRLAACFAALMLIGAKSTLGQNGAVGIAYPAQGITIDGDLGDWPVGLKTYPIERIEFGDKLKGEDDLKAHFRFAYNPGEHALYVAVEVEDDSAVLDKPGVGDVAWDAQDGCELYIDSAHAGSGSPVFQYARYGNRNQFVGPLESAEKTMKVAVVRKDSRIVYEWRIEVAADLDPERSIGFDVSVADRDKDGSFSWAAWGSGTQKASSPDRCGEFFLVTPETKFGEASGKVAWDGPSSAPLPARVRVQSTRTPQLWREAAVDGSGGYKVTGLPVGDYAVHAVDSVDLRVDSKRRVDVRIEADRPATADLLRVSAIPWPGLIGDEGVLRSAGPLNADALDRFVKAYLDYYQIPGVSVAVIKDSQVVYRKGFGVKNTATHEPVGDDTVFEAASMTKPVFAYTVLRLVDRGVLKLDTPLYTYLPYEDIAHDDRYKLITARMVMTHRTGFPNWRTGKLDIKFTPGTEVSYSGEGFVYLGKVVEKLTGKKLVDLIREEVFTPFGVEHASLVWNDDIARLTATGHGGSSPMEKGKPSEPNTAASLHIAAGEYAKFLTAVVQGRGLSEPTAQEMLRSQVKIPDQKGASWGLGIAIQETPTGVNYGHGGRNTGFTSQSLMYKDQGIGYVFLVNNDDASKIDNVLNAYLIAGKSGLKKTKVVAHKTAQVDPKIYESYVGRYQLTPAVVLTFTREGEHLKAQATGEGASEVFPESETVFFMKPTQDATITFVKDGDGKVTHIVLHEEDHDTQAKRLDDEPKAGGGK